jgi:hypothetical protein
MTSTVMDSLEEEFGPDLPVAMEAYGDGQSSRDAVPPSSPNGGRR